MIKSILLASFVFAVALASVTAQAAPVATTERSEPNALTGVALDVEHQQLLEHQAADAAEDSAFFVREDVEKALREHHGLEVVDGPDAPTIIVRLAWVSYEESIYRVEIVARKPGGESEVVTTIERNFIHDTALSEGVAANLSAVLAELAKGEPDDAGSSSSDGSGDQRPEGPAVGPEHDNGLLPRRPLGPLGKTGIGLLATGVVAMGVGAGLLAQGRQPDEMAGEPLTSTGRDFRPPGGALLGAGGAIAITGAVLLIVDRARAKRRATSALRVLPTQHGIAIAGRF